MQGVQIRPTVPPVAPKGMSDTLSEPLLRECIYLFPEQISSPFHILPPSKGSGDENPFLYYLYAFDLM